MPHHLLRSPFFSGFFALLLLALAGCASSSPTQLYSRSVPFPDYAAAEPVRGFDRYTICHKDRTITIVGIAVDAHMEHGDYFGACSEDNRTRTEAYYREHLGATN